MSQDRDTRQSDFLALVAHELRTPITVAMSHAELLAEAWEAFDEGTKVEMARDILGAVLRLSGLVDDLATLGMVGGGHLRLHPGPVDLAEALAAGLAQLDPASRPAAEAAAALRDLPPVLADPDRAGRAVAELVVNGRRSVEDGAEPLVRGTAEPASVLVEVVDRGPSMGPEEMALAFNRLGRRPGVRSRRVTGLGVTVARVLVEAMGGEVGVRNNDDGTGCTFWMRLPRSGAG